jgi:hypothetical protein
MNYRHAFHAGNHADVLKHVVLHRSHEPESLPELQLVAEGNALTLALPRHWIEARPLLASDLAAEIRDFAGLGIALSVAG